MSCASIGNTDSVAASICRTFVKYGTKESRFKSSQDVYRLAIDYAIREARQNYRRFQQTADASKFVFQSPWLSYLHNKGVIIPFIFDDLKTSRTDDLSTFRQLKQQKNAIKDIAALHSFIEGSSGLSISFKSNPGNPTPHSLDAVASKKGNCLDYIYLYYGLGTLLKIDMTPHDQLDTAVDNAHVLAKSGNTFFDPQTGTSVDSPQTQALSSLELLAFYHYNNAFYGECKGLNDSEKTACAEKEIRLAERYAPSNRQVKLARAYLDSQSNQ